MPPERPDHPRNERRDPAQGPWAMSQNTGRRPTPSTSLLQSQSLNPQAHLQPSGPTSTRLHSLDRSHVQPPSHSQALSRDMVNHSQFNPGYLSHHGPVGGPSSIGLLVQSAQPNRTLRANETDSTSGDVRSQGSEGGIVFHTHNYHGPVHQIKNLRSENTFAGTSYGPVLQNSAADSNWMENLANRLKISRKADYAYYPGGNESGLRRSACTLGTRIPVIEGVMTWGHDTSPQSESVYWLSGQAGAGKTTLAYTIADQLAKNHGAVARLGGSFFCSRHSAETRTPAAIVRTLVYHMALRSASFRDALIQYGHFETVDHGPMSQLEALLVIPWQKCEQRRRENNEPCLVNTIDALDELDGEGGVDFLDTLFDVLNEHRLSGLKFVITSRLEPSIVQHIESFDKKQVFRLEKMPLEESSADIKIYLRSHLGRIAAPGEIEQLVTDADGLFIY